VPKNRRKSRENGGEGGIRTHGGLSTTPVFETGALIHYATSPRVKMEKVKGKSQLIIERYQFHSFGGYLLLLRFHFFPCFASCAEKLLHKRAAFCFKDAALIFNSMVQRTVVKDAKV
jgi:hypothetical protein